MSISCQSAEHRLFIECKEDQCPVVFHPNYDVTFFGLEKCHPFDATKWGSVFKALKEMGLISDSSVVTPIEVSQEDLLEAHTKRYLRSLTCPCVVAEIVEVPPVCLLPCCLIDRFFLKNMRLQTGGTVAAARLALIHGWAINIGGGFHHASEDDGGGFCVYADISLAIKILLRLGLTQRILIVDVDAHQGNGHEKDFGSDPRVFIIDVFNPDIYPFDHKARKFIDLPVLVSAETTDREYLSNLSTILTYSLDRHRPDLVVYNAGTDCLEGDPLGGLSLSEQGVVLRDALVFEKCRRRNVPIVMVTSGGYQKSNAAVIATSISNLHALRLIHLK